VPGAAATVFGADPMPGYCRPNRFSPLRVRNIQTLPSRSSSISAASWSLARGIQAAEVSQHLSYRQLGGGDTGWDTDAVISGPADR
jgi:hypothetical protein